MGYGQPDIRQVQMRKVRSHFIYTVLICVMFGCFLNVIQLGIPIYTMQVFDRVVPSGHLGTLSALSIMLIAATICGIFVDASRSLLSSDCGRRIAHMLVKTITDDPFLSNESVLTLTEIDDIRAFCGSPSFYSIMDLPWTFVFLFALSYIHVVIGLYVLCCMIVLLCASILTTALLGGRDITRARTRTRVKVLQNALCTDYNEILRAGRLTGLMTALLEGRSAMLIADEQFTRRQAWSDAVGRAIRSSMQVGVIALTASLVVYGYANAGAIVASSMLFTKAVSPFERVASSLTTTRSIWQTWKKFRQARKPAAGNAMKFIMPEIKGKLAFESASFIPSRRSKSVVDRVTITFEPGTVYVIVGSEGAGKSTLVGMAAGVIAPSYGKVSLDDVSFSNYHRFQLEQVVGFMPQLSFPRAVPVAEFISRGTVPDEMDVVEAACLAGIDSIIRKFVDGYQTVLAADGSNISGSQFRRLLLASAIYKRPRVLILDEPMTGMDEKGEQDVLNVIARFKEYGATVVVVSKLPRLLLLADWLIMVDEGRLSVQANATDIRKSMGPRSVVS